MINERCGYMNDIQIIGLDIANTKDCSTATSICGNCKSVISMNTVNAEKNYINVPMIRKCPICGTVFKKRIVNEEVSNE